MVVMVVMGGAEDEVHVVLSLTRAWW